MGNLTDPAPDTDAGVPPLVVSEAGEATGPEPAELPLHEEEPATEPGMAGREGEQCRACGNERIVTLDGTGWRCPACGEEFTVDPAGAWPLVVVRPELRQW